MKAKICLVSIVSSGLSASANTLSLASTEKPNWNFSTDSLDLSGSLIFDQPFDQHTFRPYPTKQPKSEKSKVKQSDVSKTASNLRSPYVRDTSNQFVAQVAPSELKPQPSVESFLLPHPVAKTPTTKVELTAPAPVKEKKSPTLSPVAEKKAAPKQEVIASPVLARSSEPKSSIHKATLWILDESAFSLGEKKGVSGATIYWIHPTANIVSESNQKGHAQSPLMSFSAARFVVLAPGYIPAVGYGVAGQTNTVLLFKEERAQSVQRGLGLDQGESLLLGKILDESLNPVKDAILDISDAAPAKMHYDARAGIFNKAFDPAPTQTSASGNFAVENLGPWLQYIMPTVLPSSEWSAAVFNLAGLVETLDQTNKGLRASELSLSIVEGRPYDKNLSVSDSVFGTKPETAIHATIGGQRGVNIPDTDGYLSLKQLGKRSYVDLLDIKARGYLDTWLTFHSLSMNQSSDVSLFTEQQLRSLMANVSLDLSNYGIVLGKVSANKLPAHNLDIEVYNSFGEKLPESNIHYFETDLFVRDGSLRFGISNIPSGEWHIVLRNTENNEPLSIGVVRADKNTVSQIDF